MVELCARRPGTRGGSTCLAVSCDVERHLGREMEGANQKSGRVQYARVRLERERERARCRRRRQTLARREARSDLPEVRGRFGEGEKRACFPSGESVLDARLVGEKAEV